MSQHNLQTQNLDGLITQFERGYIKIPDFQRSLVWDKRRREDWAKSIREKIVVPTFVMYTADDDNNNSFWLADGMQRLMTTMDILENPESYSFSNRNEVLFTLSKCSISVAILFLKDHEEGYKHFRNLNSKGVSLSPYDVYRGVMVTDKNPSSSWIYKNIYPLTKERIYKDIQWDSLSGGYGGDKVQRKSRGLLSLLAQYISNYKGKIFWNVSSSKPTRTKGKQVEHILAEFFLDKTQEESEKILHNFIETLGVFSDDVFNYITNHKPNGFSISFGLWENISHCYFYAINNEFDLSYSYEYFKWMIDRSKTGTSRIIFETEDGSSDVHILDADKLSTGKLLTSNSYRTLFENFLC